MLLKSWFEVTQSIFLQSCLECRTQWSQHSRHVVLKWLRQSSIRIFAQLIELCKVLQIAISCQDVSSRMVGTVELCVIFKLHFIRSKMMKYWLIWWYVFSFTGETYDCCICVLQESLIETFFIFGDDGTNVSLLTMIESRKSATLSTNVVTMYFKLMSAKLIGKWYFQTDLGRFQLQRFRFQHTFSTPIPVILVTIPTPIPTPTLFLWTTPIPIPTPIPTPIRFRLQHCLYSDSDSRII